MDPTSNGTLQDFPTELRTQASAALDAERAHLAELKKQQRSIEADDNDLSAKLNKFEKELYGGKVRNPKELLDLQREVDALKSKRTELEEKELVIMEQADTANTVVEKIAADLAKLQAGRREQNNQLTS